MTFEDLQLISPLMNAVKESGYLQPTPIQAKTIPHTLAGKDLLGIAQTGTGKTAAFALPILQRLYSPRRPRGKRPFRALVLTPTRELASQIADSFAAYGKHTGLQQAVVFGGVNQNPQAAALDRGVDILIATPGRLIDLTQQGLVDYYAIEAFVLDEADRMLDMGFIHDVRRIVQWLPERKQTMFFSATMPPEVQKLADGLLRDPVQVAVSPPNATADAVTQSIYFVEKPDKPQLLAHLLRDPAFQRTLIFTRTKHGADKVTRHLVRSGVTAQAIHGNKTQNARERALDFFKQGRIRALVATDLASRGIDVENITHVINFDLPNIPESYIHRIGRTGRAQASGAALSFCDESERPYLADIERLMKKWIPQENGHPFASSLQPPHPTELEPKRRPAAPPARQKPASAMAGGRRWSHSGPQRRPQRPV